MVSQNYDSCKTGQRWGLAKSNYAGPSERVRAFFSIIQKGIYQLNPIFYVYYVFFLHMLILTYFA